MTDEQLMDSFHRVELRLERLDAKVESLEKGLADVGSELRTRFEGLENRLKEGRMACGEPRGEPLHRADRRPDDPLQVFPVRRNA